jgi:alginate O-acetyltransferase complex protein AlgI
MLFNSYAFLLLFLPVTLAGFFWIARRSEVAAAAWLALASLVFYGWWDYRYIPLLLASIAVNYALGWRIGHAAQPARKRWLALAIAANLLLLGYYKYADFFIGSANALLHAQFPLLGIVLPIGISFFTFTQIAFLVDTYQGKASEYRFTHYVLFVTYFPHLIAGPVLHHKEMMPQFAHSANYRVNAENFAVGATIFFIGLAKKVLIADNLAPYAGDVFNGGASPSLFIAWYGVLAYAFQLYFDFSGYSDMAIGLSRLFGVKLPLNFASPYKAENIIEFWRCWHMTLSRFLRDYLYIPLGGSRHGPGRRYSNLMATMLLGGLWHGAGWNYVIWGGLHGLYLVVNHAWAHFCEGAQWRRTRAWRIAAIALTFVAVCFAWVFFRAPDLPRALAVVQGMLGGFGVSLPEALGQQLGALRPALEQLGVSFYLGGGTRFVEAYAWIVPAALIAFFAPNTQQIMAKFEPALDFDSSARPVKLHWQPSRAWAWFIGALAVVSLLALNRPSEFLYFQF